MWPTKAGVASSRNQLCDRFAVAIRRIAVAPFIGCHPKGVHLAVGDLLDTTSIGAKPKGVPRVHGDHMPVGAGDLTLVIKAMAGVNPSVSTIA